MCKYSDELSNDENTFSSFNDHMTGSQATPDKGSALSPEQRFIRHMHVRRLRNISKL